MSKVGKKFIYKGVYIGKVIADVGYRPRFFKNTYFVLLNEIGKKNFCGWMLEPDDEYEKKMLCGKYGNDPNNRFWVFDKDSYRSKYFNFKDDSKTMVMKNE